MKKILRRTFKILATLLVVFLALAIIIPILFKDKIVAEVKVAINDSINAKVDFEDVDISLLRDFPDISMGISKLEIVGIDTFKNIPLATMEGFNMSFDLISVISSKRPVELNHIGVKEAKINVLVTEDGLANYDIVKPAADPDAEVSFEIQLQSYEVNGLDLEYNDRMQNMSLSIEDLDHSGSGDFTQDVFDLKTKTKIARLDAKYQGIPYASDWNVLADMDILVDMVNQKYSLKDNELTLNELSLSGEGEIVLSEDKIDILAELNAPEHPFKDFLSVVPAAYTPDFEDVTARGRASVMAKVSGTYIEEKNIYPSFDIKTKISDGYLKYPELPQDISDINVDINLASKDQRMENIFLDISSFKMKIGENPIDGYFNSTGDLNNPRLVGAINGLLDFATLKDAFPIPDVKTLKGQLALNCRLNTYLQDALDQIYDKVEFTGDFDLRDFQMVYADYPEISIDESKLSVSPQKISLQKTDLILGKSDLAFTMDIKEPLAFFSSEEESVTNVSMNSNFLDLNEWMPETLENQNDSLPASAEVTPPNSTEINKNASVRYTTNIERLVYDSYTIDNIKSSGKLSSQTILLDNFSATIDDSDIQADGELRNLSDFTMNDGMLQGQMSIKSRKLDLNQFMTESETSSTSEQVTYMAPIIPKNVDVQINLKADELIYTNLDLKELKGELSIKNGQAILENMTTEALGGKMALEGMYDTEDPNKPGFSLKYDVSQLRFGKTFEKILTIQKLAPIAKFIDGVFNATFVVNGDITNDLMPDLTTISASGFMETLDGVVQGFGPLSKIGDKLGVSELKKWNIKNSKNWFEVENGTVNVKEFDHSIDDIAMKIGGKHSLKAMDYSIVATIPREKLKENGVTGLAETGLAFLENEAGKIGLNIDQGDFITLDISIGGSLLKPTLKIKPIASGGKTVKDVAKDQINETIDELKDEATEKATEVANTVKDSVQTVVDQQLDTLTTKAQEFIDDQKDAITGKADSMASDAINDVLENATNMLDDKTKNEVEDIKDKIKDFNPFKKRKKKDGN